MGNAAHTISCVEIFDFDFPVAHPAGPAGVTYDRRGALLVRLEDQDGVVGWGETYRGPTALAALDANAAALLGRDPAEQRRLIGELNPGNGDRLALSALAIALDDLRARQLGISVADLYGGPIRTSVGAYASSGGYRADLEPEQSWPAELDRALADGFRACKFRVGRHSISREEPILRELRERGGSEIDLMVDANGAYALPRAIQMGRVLEGLRFRWFEEPLIRHRDGLEYPGYDLLGAGLDIAIAAGEGLNSRSAFDAFLARGGASIVQPDVAICGGIGEALFVAELAQLRGRSCVPHAWGGAILLGATLQLLSLLPEPSEVPGADSPLLEVDRFENPLRTVLWGGDPTPIDGRLAIPPGPGLGITVDEEFVRRTTVRHLVHATPSSTPTPSSTAASTEENRHAL